MRAKKRFITLAEYKALVAPLLMRTESEFRKWSATERPKNAPSNPDKYYRGEWKNWHDFLHAPVVQPNVRSRNELLNS